jgi:O-acetylhomoserine (thiol)-lyase
MNDDAPNFGFDTLQIHAGARPDPSTGARQTPIYQNTAYVFRDAEHAAALFNLQEVGFIYSRLTNPTVSALQERVASLEGGVGATACSSGHGAQIMALFPLMSPGDNVVVSTRLYGGTVTQMSHTIKRFGWEAKFVDTENLGAVARACTKRTKAIFCESVCNPGGYVTDLPKLAKIADRKDIPLIVDNTSATPYLCRPIEQGATIVIHSTTKYLSGNGTSMGGMIVDSGKFDWSGSDKFPSLSQPEPAYHGLKFHETFGPLSYTLHSHAVGLRDLGMCQSPMNAFLTLLGIETLSLRMKKHVKNAQAVAEWLEKDDRVSFVSYAGLKSSPYARRVKKLYPKGAGALFTFGVKGGYDACVKLVDSVEIFSHLANLGDARSLIIHSASTTHRQLTPEQQEAAGAGRDVVRLSIGIEDPADLIADLDQALAKAHA